MFLPATARQARHTEGTIMATGPGNYTSGNYQARRRLYRTPIAASTPRRIGYLYLSRRCAAALSGVPANPAAMV